MKESDIRFTKLLVLLNAGVPALLLAWDSVHHQLGANPANFAILTTGMLTLIFLMLTLLVTPLRRITGWNWLIFSRRTLGLYAFFYGSLHFLIFFMLDRSFSVSSTLSEMLKRKYLFVGITGLLSMVPLALTSTNAMIKRLGGKRWRALHRLVYVAAIAGVIHYYMQVKADVRKPLAFAAVLSALLVWRLLPQRRQPKAEALAAAPKPKLWSGTLRIARITRETSDVSTFRLASPDGSPLAFKHDAGQYLILSPQIAGKKINRTYTIASSPARPDYCEITVKREENGLVSGHLHDTIREGDLVTVSAPAGRFTFDSTQSNSIVLIAGGVGITPLMSILRHLTDRNWNGDVYFLYSAKTPGDIIFRQELEDLDRRFPNLHLHITLTRAGETEWTGWKGRLTADFIKQTVPNIAGRPVYVCGPAAMMEPTLQLLRDLGVPADQIKSEAFIAAKRAETAPSPSDPATTTEPLPAPADDDTPTLTFARSGKSIPLTPDKSLLELGEEIGLELDFECRSGICGRCKARMLSGAVTMETQDALDDTDKSKNLILLCQAKSAGSVTIEA